MGLADSTCGYISPTFIVIPVLQYVLTVALFCAILLCSASHLSQVLGFVMVHAMPHAHTRRLGPYGVRFPPCVLWGGSDAHGMWVLMSLVSFYVYDQLSRWDACYGFAIAPARDADDRPERG